MSFSPSDCLPVYAATRLLLSSIFKEDNLIPAGVDP